MLNSWLQQSKIEILRNTRNRRFFFFSLFLPVGFYLLYVNLLGGQMKLEGTTWATYYMMSMATFSVVGAGLNGLSARIAFERTQGWLRLVQTTPLRPIHYITTKIVANLLINMSEVIVLFIVGGVIEHVHLTPLQWILSGVWIAFGGLAFIVLGILIGQLAGLDASQIIASAVYFILSILGGLWFPVSTMPSLMKHVAELMPTYHLAHVAWQLVSGKSPSLTDFAVLSGYFIVFVGIALWVTARRTDVRVA
ncbi:ABC transporter permease [Alicyclobacillus fastidiosus]|uniref:ABC transporter permease n=1 Tax=Alicyclobacillus fastidiosus TaxID=392011 RepID=A0ABV5AHR1_9BACL|nr:ABC transporter permease [Alicyclobacillus fastidiosus]WEH09233.1 ABC transporter permease [Alicyclobacillus fastidiosus]